MTAEAPKLAQAASEPIESPRKMTFAEILDLIVAADDGMETEIDLAELGDQLRDKVDAIRHVVKRLDEREAGIGKDIEDLQKRKRAIANNRDRLREYVKATMLARGESELPGQKFRVIVKPAQPALVLEREASPLDYSAHPELVEQERVYKWRKDVLKDRLKAGESFAWATLKQSFAVQFLPRKEA